MVYHTLTIPKTQFYPIRYRKHNSDNESNCFSQPDIASNDQAAPDCTDNISFDASCKTPNLRCSLRIRRPIDRYDLSIDMIYS